MGSSGQIGTYLTEYLRSKDHEVTEFDIARHHGEDLTQIPNHNLDRAVKNADFIFFLAFDVGGSRYLKKYQHTFEFINNNSRIMVNTFETLRKYNKPFIFASSQMSNMSFSSYGVSKSVGELYTKSLNGLVVKFWNVYGIEKDYEKSHVITDFILKGFETGIIDMITDGQEEREFLYADDCCEALEVVMNRYSEFTSEDNLHITSFISTKVIDLTTIIKSLFTEIGIDVRIEPSTNIDTVQHNSKNVADKYFTKWWTPKTELSVGIKKVFDVMKKNYD
ncbi:MAG: NAD-dependent epimerase/dehydratase family protein [Candidatus Hodarchaeales archaeon]